MLNFVVTILFCSVFQNKRREIIMLQDNIIPDMVQPFFFPKALINYDLKYSISYLQNYYYKRIMNYLLTE